MTYRGDCVRFVCTVVIGEAVKPGDKVSFTAEREDGVMTIEEITKE
jgi:hypothetical protein